jgi:hypothetical protein
MKLYGIDLSQEQINFLRESYPDLKADVKVMDATIPFPENFPKVDLSFTQAVIMHIHTGDSHLTALANLFNASNKYVLLMERWKSHQFMNDIKELFDKRVISWNNLYFYYKSDETNRPHLIICSNEPLPSVYPILNNYKIMPKD